MSCLCVWILDIATANIAFGTTVLTLLNFTNRIKFLMYSWCDYFLCHYKSWNTNSLTLKMSSVDTWDTHNHIYTRAKRSQPLEKSNWKIPCQLWQFSTIEIIIHYAFNTHTHTTSFHIQISAQLHEQTYPNRIIRLIHHTLHIRYNIWPHSSSLDWFVMLWIYSIFSFFSTYPLV